ncbi:TMEM165/GDT1 family protein [Pseudonocardia sp. HH130630-07]|uniref:TMEM165/GDT1 family protein n=1 Tax=Pseudonocardia sp. HH130630-07 TaxID=1690815 RepID=UPI000815368D|nr:TMEM165/GDT1 family protein [Pseudonocardia sp. HH130630-07]ANY06069.1 hypothetical protein AFB00_06860 [Pseudonocardia sp. HH130630-07]
MTVAAIAFGLVFLAELVDTSALATLVLGARFAPRWVLLGVCAGMAVHVVVAVAAGSLVALLPQRPLAAVLAVVFVIAAVVVLREGGEDADGADDTASGNTPRTRWGVVLTGFGATVLSEFADPTQWVIATLSARYAAPLAVGIGSLLALWAVSALAVYGGARLRRLVPVHWVTRATAAILAVLAVLSAVEAIRG